jgi:hypothetical protein
VAGDVPMIGLERAGFPQGMSVLTIRGREGNVLFVRSDDGTAAERRRALCEARQAAARCGWLDGEVAAHAAPKAGGHRGGRRVLAGVAVAVAAGVITVSLPGQPVPQGIPAVPAARIARHPHRRQPAPSPEQPGHGVASRFALLCAAAGRLARAVLAPAQVGADQRQFRVGCQAPGFP